MNKIEFMHKIQLKRLTFLRKMQILEENNILKKNSCLSFGMNYLDLDVGAKERTNSVHTWPERWVSAYKRSDGHTDLSKT